MSYGNLFLVVHRSSLRIKKVNFLIKKKYTVLIVTICNKVTGSTTILLPYRGYYKLLTVVRELSDFYQEI